MKSRLETSGRCLPESDRQKLKEMLAALPPDATATDLEAIGLREFIDSLDIPWFSPSAEALVRLRSGGQFLQGGGCARVVAGLHTLSRCLDWGAEAYRRQVFEDDTGTN